MDKNILNHAGIKGMKWGVRRYQNKDGSLTPEGRKRYSEDYLRAHDKKSIKSMSNKELMDRNKRLQMEKQYKDLNRKTNVGKKAINAYIAGAGTITAAAAATATYKKFGKPIFDKAITKIGSSLVPAMDIGELFD